MRDVAAEAGVSQPTVSRALQNDPRLTPETRERIQAIAKRLGYTVHPMVSTVLSKVRAAGAEQHMGTLGFITAWPRRDDWRKFPTATFVRFYNGAAARAEQLGYRLEEFWLKERGMSGRRMSNILKTQNVRGLLIAPLPMPASWGHLSLDWRALASVAIGYSLWRPNLDRAASHMARNTALALRHLRHRGYRRIGLALISSWDERSDFGMSYPFLYHQQRIPAAHRVPVLRMNKPEERSFLRWFDKHRPDAILTAGPFVLQWLGAARSGIPPEVGVAITDLSDFGGAIAGINQRAEAIGAAAVDLVTGKLNRREHEVPDIPKMVLIEGEWVDGATAPGR